MVGVAYQEECDGVREKRHMERKTGKLVALSAVCRVAGRGIMNHHITEQTLAKGFLFERHILNVLIARPQWNRYNTN